MSMLISQIVILGASAKLLQATYQLRRACPPFRKEQLGSHWTGFHEIGYLNIFRKTKL
jgi:hypothetical protein